MKLKKLSIKISSDKYSPVIIRYQITGLKFRQPVFVKKLSATSSSKFIIHNS
ncbi:MAG: hypothetical protein AAB511_04160 [Patescibacteria group bacterium]